VSTTEEITWVGHATVLLDLDGFRVLTDPLLTARVAHLRRRRPPPDPDSGDVDLVLLSHAHMDHLHPRSLRRISPRARYVTPVGSSPVLRAADLDSITEVSVGDRVQVGPVTVQTVPAAHRSGRGPHSRVKSPPVGYVVDTGRRRFYFAGDTDLFEGMRELDDIDVALLPIWGWGPTIGEGHLDPGRAAEAVDLIEPRLVVPMHWGTYSPETGRRKLPTWFDQPVERFSSELGAGGHEDRLHVLQPGESISRPLEEDDST
jgi:L-ascorbate metabolism protein UlaG (beta-lactamase superfamily)